MSLLVLAVPLAAFLSAALLPKGRPTLLGIALAALVGGAVWVLLPEGGYRALLLLGLLGLLLAGLAQALRLLLPAEGPLARAYPALLLAALALAPVLARTLLT